jgi:hypothetical protein
VNARRQAWRLAARFVRPRRRAEWLGAAGTVVAAALVTVALTLIGAMLMDLAHRLEVGRSRGLEVLAAELAEDGFGRVSYDVITTAEDALELYRVTMPDAAIPGPPGAQWPGPGELWLSPALAEARQADPYLAAVTPGKVAGLIDPSGLRGPDELVAYVGVSRSGAAGTLGYLVTAGFGTGDDCRPEDLPARQLLGVSALSCLIVAIGVLGLARAAGRLAAPSRARRLAVLSLLGAPPRTVRATARAMAGLLGGIGAAIGGGLALPARYVVSGLEVMGVRHWQTRHVDPWLLGVAAGLALAVMMATAGRALDYQPIALLKRRPEPRTSVWLLWPLAVSVAVLIGILIASRGREALHAPMPTPVLATLMIDTVAIAALLAAAGPRLTLGAIWLGRRGGLVSRLAAARSLHHARSSNRLAIPLVCATIGLGAGTGYLAAAADVLAEWGTPESGRLVMIEPPQQGDLANIADAVEFALASPSLRSATMHLPGAGEVPLQSADQVPPDAVAFAFVFSPADAADAADAAETAARAVTNPTGPLPQVDFGSNPAGRWVFSTLGAAMLYALWIALPLLAIGLAGAMMAVQEDRRDGDEALLVAGMSRRRLAAVRAVELLMVAGSAPLIAAVLGVLLGVAYEHYDDSSLPYALLKFSPIVWLVAAVCCLLAATAAVATPTGKRLNLRRT